MFILGYQGLFPSARSPEWFTILLASVSLSNPFLPTPPKNSLAGDDVFSQLGVGREESLKILLKFKEFYFSTFLISHRCFLLPWAVMSWAPYIWEKWLLFVHTGQDLYSPRQQHWGGAAVGWHLQEIQIPDWLRTQLFCHHLPNGVNYRKRKTPRDVCINGFFGGL